MRRIATGRSAGLLAAATAGTLLLGACGGDDDATGDAGDAAAYCDLVEVLESQDSRPTDEQLEQLAAVAPAEIRDDVELFGDAIANDDMEAEGVAEAESNILAWEEDNCT
ncbi:MAG: hypothetical protein KY469_20265 [Actinobacteria bacterium]|nr:hypothetical protein [Actinomycetota bacterium]